MSGIKFTKCVIGPNFIPVGFVYTNNGVERYEDFASLCRRNATDGKLYFSESGVFGLYSNSVNNIDICRETVGGGYSDPIDPSIELTQRIISGGKVVGFVVKDSTGAEVKKHIASILSAAKYMKPANFKVVERNGNQFLQGKGVRLSTLPAIDLTPGLKTTTRPRTVRSEPYDAVDPKLTRGVSLARLTHIIAECGGAILKLNEDAYTPVGATYVEDGSDFTRMKAACEIAQPIIDAATKKISASLLFKVPGSVFTSEGAALAYIYRKKNIVNIHYEDGVLRHDKHRLGRVVIAIPEENEMKFYEAVAGTVAIEKMEGTKATINTAMKLVNIEKPVFMAVDLTNITLLGAEYDSYLMVAEQIKDALLNIRKYKYAYNYAKNVIEGLKFSVSFGPKPVWQFYQRFSSVALQELQDMNVDISNGNYTDKVRKQSANPAAVDKSEDVEIIYELADVDALTLPKDPLDVLCLSLSDIPQEVRDIVKDVATVDDSYAKMKLAENLKKTAEATYKKYERQLFYHKVAMLLDGNDAVHNHDRGEWTSASVSARAQFTKYTHDCGIVVKLRQITMSR